MLPIALGYSGTEMGAASCIPGSCQHIFGGKEHFSCSSKVLQWGYMTLHWPFSWCRIKQPCVRPGALMWGSQSSEVGLSYHTPSCFTPPPSCLPHLPPHWSFSCSLTYRSTTWHLLGSLGGIQQSSAWCSPSKGSL